MIETLPISLDRTLPFVQSVWNAAADSSKIATAAQQLLQIERDCGIEVLQDLNQDSVLSAGTFRPKEAAVCYAQLLTLLTDIEKFNSVYEESDDGNVEAVLHRFLNQTQFVIQGVSFSNDYFLRLSDGTIHAWSQRAWGQELADWANKTQWGPHQDKQGNYYRWKYVDFYIGLSNRVIEDYVIWETTLLQIINFKCQRQLAVQ